MSMCDFKKLNTPFLFCLVYLPLTQSIHTSKSVKSKFGGLSFFTDLSNLSLDIWLKRLYQKQAECSSTKLRLVQLCMTKSLKSQQKDYQV